MSAKEAFEDLVKNSEMTQTAFNTCSRQNTGAVAKASGGSGSSGNPGNHNPITISRAEQYKEKGVVFSDETLLF